MDTAPQFDFWGDVLARVVLAQLLPILLAVKVAGEGRSQCSWSAGQLRMWMWASILILVPTQALMTIVPMVLISPIGIVMWIVTYYAAFLLARSLYRKSDLRQPSNSN